MGRSHDARRLSGHRVLVLAKAFPPAVGGIETYSAEVAAEYARRGAEVTVMSQFPAPACDESLKVDGATIRVVNVGPCSQLRVFAKLMLQVRSYLAEGQPRFVHSTTWRPGLVALLLTRSCPTVVTVHGREILNSSRALTAVMRQVLRRCSAGVAVSPSTMRLLDTAVDSSSRHGRWAVAWNGVTNAPARADFVASSLASGRVLRLFTLCRLVARKNVERTVEALGALHRDGITNFSFRIAGDGPMFGPIQAAVRDQGLESVVALLGRIDDSAIAAEYEQCDVFVHPQSHVGEGNDFEGFGLVVADAMAFGRVTIAGRDGGPGDFIDHGRTGILVDGNHVDEIRHALRAVLTGEVDLELMGRAAMEFAAAQFTWEGHVDTILSLLELDEPERI